MKREPMELVGTVLDDSIRISLAELCGACGVNAEYVIDMVEEGLVEPRGASPREWRFTGTAIRRVQIALRLQRDLRINLSGAALALDLLDELEELRRLHKRESGS